MVTPNGTINPNELVFTGSYALKLSETFSSRSLFKIY